MQGKTFVFFGQVGSGKGTQVKLLQEFLENSGMKQVYIGTGEIFRKIAESADNNPEAQAVKDILSSGRLMPDEVTNRLVSDAVSQSNLSPDKHLIFDGYPRTVAQAQYFWNLINSLDRGNVKIVYIELSEQEAMRRNLLRGRHDDTEAGLKKRFDEYVNNVIPAMNYLKEKEGCTIYTISGEQVKENVHQDIIRALSYSNSEGFKSDEILKWKKQ